MATTSPSPGKPLVLIDGREISKKRGIGHFCRELLYNINENTWSTDTRYMCLVPFGTPENFAKTFSNIDFITSKVRDPIVWEQVALPIEAWRRRATHLICPYNTFPISLSPNVKRIIVYHDLIFLHASRVGGGAKLFFGNKYRSFLVRFLRDTDLILAVSEYTRDILRRFLGIDSVIIGNSCKHIASLITDARPIISIEEYFLHIGGDALTKNTQHIIASFLIARKMAGPRFPRLIVLGASRNYAEALKKTLRFGDEVSFRFSISDEEKSSIIKGCLAVVLVSTREGFGLPIIEAHAAQRRVITSRRRPMSDIAAASDLLVSPNDKSELIAAYLELAQRPDRCTPVAPDSEVMINQFQIIEDLLG
jgi:glycosyltransferase involved in cell wall biosynthesis